MKKRLLLHVCCAPCCTVPFGRLAAEGFDVTLFFYNPNIQPKEEHDRRLKELEKFVNEGSDDGGFQENAGCERQSAAFKKEKMVLIVNREDREKWSELTRGLECEPEGGKRCLVCYRMRLEKTAEYAKKHDFDAFATSLTLSPHKNAMVINAIGQELAEKYGLEYYVSDFKKQNGFKESLEKSRDRGFYRQDYCGCEFSWKNRKNG